MEHPENSPEFAGLQVNSGVTAQSIINPYLKRNRFRRRELSVAEMVEGIVKGDVTILSQAVTLIESVKPKRRRLSTAACPIAARAFVWESVACLERANRPVLTSLVFMCSKNMVADWLFLL